MGLGLTIHTRSIQHADRLSKAHTLFLVYQIQFPSQQSPAPPQSQLLALPAANTSDSLTWALPLVTTSGCA